MELETAYHKLLSIPGYSFIVDEEGNVREWAMGNFKPQWFHRFRKTITKSDLELHLIPGSFNPLHDSHREIFIHAGDYLSNKTSTGLVCYEMSIGRVDKPAVTFEQLAERLQQFRNYAPVVVSKAARFVEKIGVYLPNAENLTFHVGIDCVTRMKDDYGLLGIQGLRANFIVYDRIMNDKLMSLSSEFHNQIPINCKSANIVRSQESLTRSSTAIRNKQ